MEDVAVYGLEKIDFDPDFDFEETSRPLHPEISDFRIGTGQHHMPFAAYKKSHLTDERNETWTWAH